MQKKSNPEKQPGVPSGEIRRRIEAFQDLLSQKGIELALVRQNADLFYLTGTVQDGHLLVPAQGEPVFLVWRVLERAQMESPIPLQYGLKSLRALPSALVDLGLDKIGLLGLEMDVLPANLYKFYTEEIWPGCPTTDISTMLRQLRCKKSLYEIGCIEEACKQVRDAIQIVPEILKEGITELELSAAIEAELRKKGHCGLLRMRIWNQEMGMGQVVSGPNGTVPAWTNTPIGGKGPHPAFGMGASSRPIKRSEPVSIDIGGWFHGYCSDQTRLFSIGLPPPEIERGFFTARDILKILEEKMRPGASCGQMYDLAMKYADKQGLAQYFMGYETKVRFIGHGLGIELDEYPFVSKGNKMVLEQDMILALEPKFVFPGLGAAGIENTYRVRSDGLEQLTLSPEELVVL